MNKLLVRLFACLIIFTFLLPTPVAQAGFRNTVPSQTNASELDPEQFIYLPLIMNGTAVLPAMGGTVAITGTEKFGEILTATPTLTNAGTPTYQWNRGGVAITGATASTYTLVEADITTVITVAATADGTVGTGSITSAATGAIAKADGPAAPTESITGTFPVAATSINLAALANGATGLEAAVAINGSTYVTYAALTVDGSGNATISGLVSVTTSTRVRIRVKETATTLAGTDKEITATAASTVLKIGDSYQGGIVAYIFQSGIDSGYVTGQVHGLIAATVDQGTSAWSNITDTLIGTTGTTIGTGQANTTAIIGQADHTGSAAKLCNDLVVDSYTDWYLPSKDELAKLYAMAELKFGGFAADGEYWSSSEYISYAWVQYFGAGGQYGNGKGVTHYVRAVRAF